MKGDMMAGIISRAETTWQGDLAHGNGETISESGALGQLPVSWAARTKREKGLTSPEELLAAAQSACYAMAFSATLARKGAPPTKLHVAAECTFEVGEGGARISTMRIDVQGTVPGIDEKTFAEAALEAEKGCPVANALRNNVIIHINAKLANNS
jgi:osmotically inducible protein OsmC